MKDNYEVKVRGRLGVDESDLKEIEVQGRKIKVCEWGWSWEADSRHWRLVLEYFGFNGKRRPSRRAETRRTTSVR